MEFVPGTSLAPPSEREIKSLEEEHRITLPRDFVDALQAGNGAVPVKTLFMQGRRERKIERMLCLLGNASEDDVNGWYDMDIVMTQLGARLSDDGERVGNNVVPIAALFAGDFVCLDFRKSTTAPTIVVWDHEMSEDFAPRLEEVASSFGAFDAMLK